MSIESLNTIEKRIAKAGTVLALSAVAIAGCSDGEGSDELPGPVMQYVDDFLHDSKTVCGDFADPINVEGEPAVVVDARCDANPSAPVYFYANPRQVRSEAVRSGNTGEIFLAECKTAGDEPIRSYDPDTGRLQSSDMWVKVALPDGGEAYVPGVWVQGEQNEAIPMSEDC